jgi:hypothetical protein
MQAVVDFDGKFISYDLGWPGATNDMTIWKQCHISTHRDAYFARDEYLMADKGKSSLHVC